MKKTLGIIGGMGPMATADLLRKIVSLTKADSDRDHMRILIDDHAQIPDRTAAILSGGEDPLPYMLDSAQKLASIGAECLIMPCNTAHYFLPELKKEIPLPFVSMLEATARVCADRYGIEKKAGILATKGTIASGLYQKALEERGVPYVLPDETERDALMQVIYDGVKAGAAPESYRENMQKVTDGMSGRGADYYILGCTELPVAYEELGMTVPAVDPTTELARAAIVFCGYETRQ